MLLFSSYIQKIILCCTILLFLTGCTSAGSATDFQTMLVNLSQSYPALWKLVTGFAYVMGFAFILKAVYALKAYGESRTMMSSNASLKGPLFYFLAGAMLIFSPTTFQVINMTFFGTPNILSYTEGGTGAFSQASITAVLGVVQFVGLIAFIRGWIFIAKAGDQGGGQPVLGKALTHIIGGALAINIVQLKDVIWNTFGFS